MRRAANRRTHNRRLLRSGGRRDAGPNDLALLILLHLDVGSGLSGLDLRVRRILVARSQRRAKPEIDNRREGGDQRADGYIDELII